MGAVYFPSWDGYVYAVKESDGSLIWKQNLQQLTGINSTGVIFNVNVTASRTTPTIAEDLLIIGITGPAFVVAVKRSNGEMVWSTLLDANPAGCITMSGTYYKGKDIVVAVQKSRFAWALDHDDGNIIWSTEAGPGGLTGGGMWGAATDEKRVHTNIVNSDR
ncbi:hypothetical protein V6N13_044376 [Hibiscus sabdariffa]|uniref:Pyrrolo-quinoline quinone repeat domain-containing protein n=1 Tax=Hibiscus sabdariffa TaxID=183260 RepID=A0ABR2RI55_9ROSI